MEPSTVELLALGALPGHLVRRAQQLHMAIWAARGPDDLTSPQFAVLHVLAQHPGLDQTELGAAAALDRSTLAELVARLEGRGLLRRERDPADGRRKLLCLTETGMATHADAVPRVLVVNDELVAALAGHEQSELRRLLMRMLENVDDART